MKRASQTIAKRHVNGGRVNQKARTRAALVDAAAKLMRAGAPPTVTVTADEAKVSRATAYRYFPAQEALLIELSLASPAVASVDEQIAALDTDDPQARLAVLITSANKAIFFEETAMRTALRLYMDMWLEAKRRGEDPPQLRAARRMQWLDETLKPLRKQLATAQWRRLRAALALTMGAEAMVVMKDVCELKDKEALEVLQWAGVALLKSTTLSK